MLKQNSMRLGPFLLAGFILVFVRADDQQPAPPNPYLQGTAGPDQGPRGLTRYMPAAITETFTQLMARLSAEKPGVEQRTTLCSPSATI